jgi:hypothetical protein
MAWDQHEFLRLNMISMKSLRILLENAGSAGGTLGITAIL